MNASDRYVCEAKVDGLWRPVTLAEALSAYRDAPRRCPACHGPVAVTGRYSSTRRATIVHRREYSGCPLKPKLFAGVATLHPDALT